VAQVRECAQRLVVDAKRRGVSVVLVGHVTKDGSIAGPRLLEHVVDTVLAFEGDRHHALRLLRAVKHRFGPTNELGLFEMTGSGLQGVPDAARLFLADRRSGAPGTAVAATIEGHRPLVVEVQSLTVPTSSGAPPRRSVHGVDGARMALLLAVLERRAGLRMSHQEVYASTVGGVRLAEPGADLAVCLAVASAAVDRALPSDLVAVGEVGLGGEVRQVGQAVRRLAEAARLGFTRALVPATSPRSVDGIRLVPVSTIGEALAAAGLVGEGR
jgi:DNA repair protein RadA/Sms